MARFKIGDKVILGDHLINGEQRDFNSTMRPFVGKVAQIYGDAGIKPAHYQAWYVDIDNGRFYWYEVNMKPAIEYPHQKCSDCQTPAPHGEPKNGVYVCDFCKAIRDMEEPTSQQKYEKNWYAVFGKK